MNTYGVPRYQEVNPGYFTAMSFPLLFGVMFGDIGHGGVFLIAGVVMILLENSLRHNSGLRLFYDVRFMLLSLGFFGTYMGLIYNDFMSIPLKIFGESCFTVDEGTGHTEREEGCVYPFGFDPIWYRATNELSFFNSFKMKLAILIGVTQMSLGILMKGFNAAYFRSITDFVFEFLPQIIFMSCTFGYMCFTILLKWSTEWVPTSTAPSIITTFINMPLKLGSTEGMPLWGDDEGQQKLQQYLLCKTLFLF